MANEITIHLLVVLGEKSEGVFKKTPYFLVSLVIAGGFMPKVKMDQKNFSEFLNYAIKMEHKKYVQFDSRNVFERVNAIMANDGNWHVALRQEVITKNFEKVEQKLAA